MNPLKPFSIWLRPHLHHIAFGILPTIESQAVGAAMPMILKWAIDTGREGLAGAESRSASLAADVRVLTA